MGVKIRKKGNYLYLDIMYKGKRRWESIGLTVPKDAASRRETMAQAEAIRQRNVLALIAAGGNAYYLAKFAGIFGLDMQDIGAQQTGLSKAEFQARLLAAGA